MEIAATSPIRNGAISFTDLIRAGLTSKPVSIPVAGTAYARLQHVKGVPASHGDQGYSFMRLKTLDALISRIRGSDEEIVASDAGVDPVEEREQLIERMTLRIVEEMQQGRPDRGLSQGFLIDTMV